MGIYFFPGNNPLGCQLNGQLWRNSIFYRSADSHAPCLVSKSLLWHVWAWHGGDVISQHEPDAHNPVCPIIVGGAGIPAGQHDYIRLSVGSPRLFSIFLSPVDSDSGYYRRIWNIFFNSHGQRGNLFCAVVLDWKRKEAAC